MDWRSGKVARAVTRLLAILILSGATSSAFASNVQFVGSVGYSSDYKTFAILVIDNVKNLSPTGVSANLRAELWATATPFSGSFSSAYRMAAYGIAPLAAGASTGRISATTGFTPPPGGTWYVAMVLTEYTGGAANDGYALRQYLNFPGTIWFAGSDATPPTVSIASPTGGSVSGTVTVSASASDNIGVSRVDLWINGALALSDAAAPYQFSWDTTKLANGLATLRAVAYDTSGNAGLSALVTVTIANGTPPDTTPPTVSISSPTGGNVSGTVTVSASASDNVGVARVDFYVNGGLVDTDSAAPYQYSWNTTSLPNGAAQLKAVAYDAAGNSTQSAIVTVNVANADMTPPTVNVTSPTGGNVSGTVTVSASASDNVGVAHVDFYVNGGLVGSDSAAPYQYSWNTTSVANGAAQLKAVAYDAAGNSAQSAIVTVNVANGGPGLPPLLQSAVSRKTHASAGTFDLPLSLSITSPTIEPRTGPAHTLVFTFDKPITGATVAVTEGVGTAAAPTFSGNDVVVDLTGVSNQQYATVTLTNVTSSDGGSGGSATARLGLLLGDVNQSHTVTVLDIVVVNGQLAKPVSATNFLLDVNINGMLTVLDKVIVNANLAKALPAP